MKILTITSNDLGISWGPAIHYLELWNEVSAYDQNYDIDGIAPSWTGDKPISPVKFNLKLRKVPNVGKVRQIFYDLYVAWFIALNYKKYDYIYIRLSHWHYFQLMVLNIFNIKFILELNGLTKEDSISAEKSKLEIALISFQEKWFVKNAKLNICVSEGIERTIQNRYGSQISSVTISNGVASKFFLKNQNNYLKTVAYVGTFTSWDGARQIIELAVKFPELQFKMVGDGQIKGDLQKVAPKNVEFLGRVNYWDLPKFYMSVDAGIVLYEFERHRNVKVSSLKTLEYIAAQLPVFTTDINGQQFIAESGFGYTLKENANIEQGFRAFISSFDTYKQNYLLSSSEFPVKYGWKGTAIKTCDAIAQISKV